MSVSRCAGAAQGAAEQGTSGKDTLTICLTAILATLPIIFSSSSPDIDNEIWKRFPWINQQVSSVAPFVVVLKQNTRFLITVMLIRALAQLKQPPAKSSQAVSHCLWDPSSFQAWTFSFALALSLGRHQGASASSFLNRSRISVIRKNLDVFIRKVCKALSSSVNFSSPRFHKQVLHQLEPVLNKSIGGILPLHRNILGS
ncbi:UNVERIFIED_CONTAM: hypothetical protein Scaly_2543400 [Sesamum calycinum]|uniref:Uncharacterized protein n=1 Tax=Sesamum calycinum TaxID=2727403 RepID=A0AAW2J5E4_9LAMI